MADAPHPRLIFHHIPKAAGSSLQVVLRRHYKRGEMYEIEGQAVEASLEAFRAMPEQARDRFRCVAGHQAYSLYDAVPEPKTCFTMLREPIDRAVSFYYYAKQLPSHYLHRLIDLGSMSLDTFAACDRAGELDNPVTRSLTGQPLEQIAAAPDEAAQTALRILEREFLCVGMQDRFDASILLLHRLMGWRKYAPYRRQNTTEKRRPVQATSEQALARLRERNHADLVVFQACSQRFDEQLAEALPGLETELERYHRLCRRYKHTRAATAPFRKVIRRVQSLIP